MSSKQSFNSLEVMGTYIEAMENPNPRHFEMIPDILDYLTYIERSVDKEGNVIYQRKRLRPIEKDLYRIISKAAGQNGCWKSTQTLAEQVNVSVGAIVEAKKILSQSFEQLDGKPLISIQKRYIPWEDKEKGFKNKKPNDVISMTYIWKYNNAFMAIIKDIDYAETWKCGLMDQKDAELAIEQLRQLSIVDKSAGHSDDNRAPEGHSDDNRAHREARSDSDVNHTHKKHTPYEYSYPPASPYNDPNHSKMIYDFMTEIGIYPKMQKKLVERTSERYVFDKIKEMQALKWYRSIKNKGAYLKMMVEEKS